MDLFERLSTRAVVTGADLAAGLARLGVRPGAIVETHVALGAFGWVIGGMGTLVESLLAHGVTVASFTGWDGTTFHLDEWPPHVQRLVEEHLPAYDPVTSAAEPGMGRFAERVRTWPGAVRSDHPEASVSAVGPRAPWLCTAGVGEPDDPDDAFGTRSPIGRLVASGGQVLMLGAPLSTVTLVHHAEAIVAIPGKRRKRYRLPVTTDGVRVWKPFHDIDTSQGAFDYPSVLGPDVDYVEAISSAALGARGIGTATTIGEAACVSFEARPFVEFALTWLTERFA